MRSNDKKARNLGIGRSEQVISRQQPVGRSGMRAWEGMGNGELRNRFLILCVNFVNKYLQLEVLASVQLGPADQMIGIIDPLSERS